MLQVKAYFQRVLREWAQAWKVGLFVALLLMVLRIALMAAFWGERGKDSGLGDILFALGQGFKFDLRVGAMVAVPFMVLGMILYGNRGIYWLEKLRIWIGSFVCLVTFILGVVNIGFFSEYHDQFNHWIFGVIYDDFNAVLQTIWGDYPMVWITLLVVVGNILILWIFRKWMELGKNLFRNEKMIGLSAQFMLFILFGVATLIAARGSIKSEPLKGRMAAVTGDDFLNKTVMNPYFALNYAVSEYNKRLSGHGIEVFLADRNVKKALDKLYPKKNFKSIDDYLVKKVETKKNTNKAKHIFVVVLESQDSWPMMDEYESFGLVPRLKQMAKEGIWVKSFLSSGGGTMESLAAIISGIPYVEVYANYQATARSTYPSSIAKQFKGLGYETNLFYGGYSNWHRLDEFSYDQGFDHVYGGGQMGAWEGNEWGVHDKQLFDYIVRKLDPKKPSFNVIMTTSNHPRYCVDLKKEGCPVVKVPEKLKNIYDGSVSLHVLGHYWYADRCLGKFVDEAHKKFGASLFAITGDHWSRHFLNKHPSLYERKSVPLVLYGPEVLKNVKVPKEMAGSHIDIAPTLLELVAPKGYEYSSFGRNMFDAKGRQMGFGVGAVITPQGILEMSYEKQFEAVPGCKGRVCDGKEEAKELYNALHGVAWARIMKGSKLE